MCLKLQDNPGRSSVFFQGEQCSESAPVNSWATSGGGAARHRPLTAWLQGHPTAARVCGQQGADEGVSASGVCVYKGRLWASTIAVRAGQGKKRAISYFTSPSLCAQWRPNVSPFLPCPVQGRASIIKLWLCWERNMLYLWNWSRNYEAKLAGTPKWENKWNWKAHPHWIWSAPTGTPGELPSTFRSQVCP